MRSISNLPLEQFVRGLPSIGNQMRAGQLVANINALHPFDGWIDLATLYPITSAGTTCKDLFQFYAEQKYAPYYASEYVDQLNAIAATDATGAFVLGGTDNYWHFVVDHVARLPAALLARNSRVIVSPDLPRTYQDLVGMAAAYLGIEIAVDHTTESVIRVRGVTVPCRIDFHWRLWFLRAFGASLQKQPAQKPERIFIRRSNASVRRLLNEDAIADSLSSAFGFVSVDPAKLTTAEQIEVMANARIVVGAHGAGLTNLIFAPKLSDLIECYVLIRQTFFSSTSAAFGHSHSFVEGTPAAGGHLTRPDNIDYHVDQAKLHACVDAAIRRIV